MKKYLVRFGKVNERDGATGLILEGLIVAPEIVLADSKDEARKKVQERLTGTPHEGARIKSISREE
jgi:hypothetical protein